MAFTNSYHSLSCMCLMNSCSLRSTFHHPSVLEAEHNLPCIDEESTCSFIVSHCRLPEHVLNP